jgi:N-methylhydantoinase B
MKTDPVLLSILQSRLKAITEEMAAAMLRTAHTVFVKETHDFATCLVSTKGEVFAAPTDTAISTMAGAPCQAIIDAVDYEPGDILICNDPDLLRGMGTHLPDIWMWMPVFVDGEILAFAVTFIHSSDIGGRVPGSISPTSTEIYQEGLRIPMVKLFRKGELNQDVLDFLLLNTRIPNQQWGDFKAQIATLNTAHRRLNELVKRYGGGVIRDAIDDVLDLAENRARKLIETIPDGDYTFVDYLEGDHAGVGLIRLKLTMKVRGSDITMDYEGTDYQVQAALNLPSWSRRGHRQLCIALLNYFRTMDPGAPYNSGLTRPIDIQIPRGTLINPEPEAAYGVRAATMFRVMDLLMGCMAQALPEIMPAAGAGGVGILLVAAWDPKTGSHKIEVAQPLSGGSGGRPKQDGIDGVSFAGGFLRNVPNEVLEADMPVLVESYGYRTDSAGAGEKRGGAGIRFELRSLIADLKMTGRGLERFVFRPWSLHGGKPGELGSVVVNPGLASERDVGKIDVLTLDSGDLVRFDSPSGAGYGCPMKRSPELVLADVRAGLITAHKARDEFGLAIEDMAVDLAETERLRQAAPQSQKTFDFGPERDAHESVWSDEVATRFNKSLKGYNNRLRPIIARYIRDGMMEHGASVGAIDELAASAVQKFGVSPTESDPSATYSTNFEKLSSRTEGMVI